MAETARELELVPDGEHRHTASEDDILPRMVCSPAEAKKRLEQLQEFVDQVMVPSVVDANGNVTKEGDYGPPFPGSKKKTLLKAGAEKLAEIYGLAVEPIVTQRIEQWSEKEGGPFFHYEVEALIRSKRTGNLVGKGVGSCNTRENRYRWRQGQRECPACGEPTIFRSKAEYGGGWYCNANKGGCGERFKPNTDGAHEIESQVVGKVENDDVHTLVNTVLKIAKKRAYVDGVISVTQSSGLFAGEDDQPRGRGKREGKDPDSQEGKKKQDNASDAGKGKQASGDKGKQQSGGAAKPDVGKQDDAHPTKVMIRGQAHWTAGIDFPRLMRVWALQKDYDKQHGEGACKDVMNEIVGVTSSHDLNEKMADKLIEHLVDLLGGNADDDFPGGY